jgi:hypothetical protein
VHNYRKGSERELELRYVHRDESARQIV